MSLLALNTTTLAVSLVANAVILTTVPASPVGGTPGRSWDVTNVLRPNATVDPVNGVAGGRSAAEYAVFQALVSAGTLVLQWSGTTAEYLTDGLEVALSTAPGLPAVQLVGFSARIGQFYRMDPTGGLFAVTLPVIAAFNKGQRIEFKNSSASLNAITLTPSGGNTIDGAASLIINIARQAVTLVSNGVSNWEVM